MHFVEPQPHPFGQHPAIFPGQKYCPGGQRPCASWIKDRSPGDGRLPEGGSVNAATTEKPMVRKMPSASASLRMSTFLSQISPGRTLESRRVCNRSGACHPRPPLSACFWIVSLERVACRATGAAAPSPAPLMSLSRRFVTPSFARRQVSSERSDRMLLRNCRDAQAGQWIATDRLGSRSAMRCSLEPRFDGKDLAVMNHAPPISSRRARWLCVAT